MCPQREQTSDWNPCAHIHIYTQTHKRTNAKSCFLDYMLERALYVQADIAHKAAVHMMEHISESSGLAMPTNSLGAFMASVHETVEAFLPKHLRVTRRGLHVCPKMFVDFVQVRPRATCLLILFRCASEPHVC
jgi:hypothetical protein